MAIPGIIVRIFVVWPILVVALNIVSFYFPVYLLSPVHFSKNITLNDQILLRDLHYYSGLHFYGSPALRLQFLRVEPESLNLPFNTSFNITVGQKKSSNIVYLAKQLVNCQVSANIMVHLTINIRADMLEIPATLILEQNGVEIKRENVPLNTNRRYHWRFMIDGPIKVTLHRNSSGETTVNWSLEKPQMIYKVEPENVVQTCFLASSPTCKWNSNSGNYVLAEAFSTGQFLKATGRFKYPKQFLFDLWEILILVFAFMFSLISPSLAELEQKWIEKTLKLKSIKEEEYLGVISEKI